jgi:hypothetical protein
LWSLNTLNNPPLPCWRAADKTGLITVDAKRELDNRYIGDLFYRPLVSALCTKRRI